MKPWCHLCPEGQYQDKQGQTSCKVCPANKFTDTKLGATSCQGRPLSLPPESVCVCVLMGSFSLEIIQDLKGLRKLSFFTGFSFDAIPCLKRTPCRHAGTS